MTENNSDGQQKQVTNLKLFRERQAEQEEIRRHKWLESEKKGYDIGWDVAKTDWDVQHKASWKKARRRAT